RGALSAGLSDAGYAQALDLIEHALILAPVAAPRVEHYDDRLAIRTRKESGCQGEFIRNRHDHVLIGLEDAPGLLPREDDDACRDIGDRMQPHAQAGDHPE